MSSGGSSRRVRANESPADKAARQAATRAANQAKRDAKRKKHQAPNGLSPRTTSLHPRTNATGSISLVDASGLQYFIDTNITFSTTSSASGSASEASFTGPVVASTVSGGTMTSTLNDMFDGYNTLCVSLTNATGPCQTGNPAYTIFNKTGPAAFDATVPVTPACQNRQLKFPAKTIGGLSVTRKIFVPNNDHFIRWMNIFTNTSGAPITFTMSVGNNLGSDSNTRIVSSSTGDNVATTADNWVSTFQNFSGNSSSDPRIGHVLQGTGAPTPLSSIHFADGDDNPYWTYSITLAPGQTKVILNFATGTGTKAAANAQAAALALLPASATQCLSNAELGEIANFVTSTDLSIVKTSTPAGSVNAAQPFTYTLAVTNTGSLANAVSVTDPLPAGVTFVSATGTGWTCNQVAGTVTCTIPTLAVGVANPITISAIAPANTAALVNTATVSSTTTDSNAANNSSTNNLSVIAQAGAAITETTSPGGTVNAGAPLAYNIGVSDLGPSTASNLTVTDVLPAGVVFVSAAGTGWVCGQSAGTVTCTLPSLLVGAANPIIINTKAPLAAGLSTDTATLTTTTSPTNPVAPGSSNSASAAVMVVANAALAITKTTSPAGTVNAGAPLVYTIGMSNLGPSTASTLTVTDALPAGVTFVSVSGTGWTCGNSAGTVTCTLPSQAVGAANPITITTTAPNAGGLSTNTATVSTTTLPVSPAPPGSSNSASAPVTVVANAALSITKTTTPAGSVNAGAPLLYTIGVSNLGPSTADTLIVTDVLPAGVTFVSASGTGWTCGQSAGTVTCTLPSLAVGAANPITINAKAPDAGGLSTNTATVSSTTLFVSPPPPGSSSSASAPVTVVANADLSIIKTATAPTAYGGTAFTYTLAVSNLGPTSASSISVSDTLPAGSSFVSASGTGWTCNQVAGVVTCTLPSLAVGAANPISLTIMPPSVALPATLVNTATVTSAAPDAVPPNNSSTSSVTLLQANAIPTLSGWMLILLAGSLGMAGLFVRRG